MTKLLLDTNFLVAPFQFSFDVYGELERLYPYAELYTLEEAVREAKSIEGGKYNELVPSMIENKEVEVLQTEGEGEVDDLIVGVAEEFVVATNDGELKRRIMEGGNPVIVVRSGNHLEVQNGAGEELG